MKINKKIFLIILFMHLFIGINMYAQTTNSLGISIGDDNTPHDRALLDIKNIETNNGTETRNGVILTTVNTEDDLPLFNENYEQKNEPRYKKDESMSGMLIYVKSKKKYLQYDGSSWSQVGNIPYYLNPSVTRLGSSEVNGYGSVGPLKIGSGDIRYNRGLDNSESDIRDGLFNNLGIKERKTKVSLGLLSFSFNAYCYEIDQDGIYNITYSFRVSGGGASFLGNFEAETYIEGQFYPNNKDLETNWVKIESSVMKPLIVLGIGAGVMDLSQTITSYFRKGDRFRVYWAPESTRFVSASGWANSVNPNFTNVVIQKID